jgi:spermidine synthase
VLRDEPFLRDSMLAAAREGGATVVDETFHHFDDGGVTGVVAVKESHLTIHTWPEHRYAAIDIFLCGPQANPWAAVGLLSKRLRAERQHVSEQLRGEAVGGDERSVGTAGTRRRMALLYVVTLVVAFCSLVYELLLAQTLSAILGNTVLRYSITIGCYLGALGVGALLCGSMLDHPIRRLVRVELALSALGGAAVPLFHFLDAGQRLIYFSVDYGSMWESIAPVGFLVLTHVVIVAIGLLSGFEVPLLLRLGEDVQPRSTNRVLGVDYFGALVGSVLFPLLFLRTLGLLATGFAVAILNAIAAGLLIASWRPARAVRMWGTLGVVTAALVVGFAHADRIEQYFLKKFYFAEQISSLGQLLGTLPELPDVERYRSPYQTIDLVHSEQPDQWIYDAVTGRYEEPAPYPRDVWLYLDREYQVYSGSDEIYHEWFVHGPIEIVGRPPRSVAVIGGGDGLVIRELLKYPGVRRIVHVELDPQMLRLARRHPVLTAMNGLPEKDPRVEVVNDDAFQWIRETTDHFDAMYIDVPRARDYNLAMLYSREFYAMVHRHVTANGFVALDAPDGWCGFEGNSWSTYYSTLRSAGFETVVPLVSRFDEAARRVVETADALAEESQLTFALPAGGSTPMTPNQERAYLRESMLAVLDEASQEFVLAFPRRRTIQPTWTDFGIKLHALTPHLLALALEDPCPTVFDPDAVNSIFRPTLPTITWLRVPSR